MVSPNEDESIMHYVYNIIFIDNRLKNDLVYVGLHTQTECADGYLCSSEYAKELIYNGYKFVRTILYNKFSTREDASKAETCLIYKYLQTYKRNLLNVGKICTQQTYLKYKESLIQKYPDIIDII